MIEINKNKFCTLILTIIFQFNFIDEASNIEMGNQEAKNKVSLQSSIFSIFLLFGVLHNPSGVSAQEYDLEYDQLMEAPTIAEIAIDKLASNEISLDNVECNEKWVDDRHICFGFTCQADGQPTPDILWYHNQQNICITF